MTKRKKAINAPDTVHAAAKDLANNDLQETAGQMKNTLIFKQALEHSAEGIAQCNEEGLTILWNKKLEKITGIPKEEVLGKPIWDVVYMMLEEEQKIKKICFKSTLEIKI